MFIQPTAKRKEALVGTLFGMAAFIIWGLSPVYWKTLHFIPAYEIILHRIVWSFLFLTPLILIQKRGHEFLSALKNIKTLSVLCITSLFIAANWMVYIWAVNNSHMVQASLGYYINPLVNVVLGVIFLNERLRPAQTVAVILAFCGVLYLTIFYGTFPWIALFLAVSFGMYGLIRKMAPVGSLIGLAVETLLLTLPAVGCLLYLNHQGTGAFLNISMKTDFFLIGASLITALPLLLFTLGARRLTLSTIGFLQYIAPTLMFTLGVFVYGEPFTSAQIITFSLIWLALSIYSADSVRGYRRRQKLQRAKI